MLSGNGIRVFVPGNVVIRVGWMGKSTNQLWGGWGCDRDGVWRGTGVVV